MYGDQFGEFVCGLPISKYSSHRSHDRTWTQGPPGLQVQHSNDLAILSHCSIFTSHYSQVIKGDYRQ